MSIKAVDFQVMVPKTSELSKLYNDEQQKMMALQQQKEAQSLHQAENAVKQVHRQDDVNKARIEEKQEKNGQKKGKGRDGQENEQDRARNPEKKDFKEKKSMIDIRL